MYSTLELFASILAAIVEYYVSQQSDILNLSIFKPSRI